MLADWIQLLLTNFGCTMFFLAILFMFIHRFIVRAKVSEFEIVYRWLALFAVGFTGIYTAYFHIVMPEVAAATIGWQPSPFQFEVGIADFTIGVLAILSFNASFGFRLATVIGVTCWLWGDALGHINQMIKFGNFAPGNAGSWFWMDVLMPLVLLICIAKLKRSAVIR
ncbi:MAG: hypothetical protein A3F14_03785 [Gammaproteobacteria bacterium RIFCSPHIGHO2_12_FULL_43_28]|nr:MAG: hypothetical protein A3F14_03785 [Gammaproteobacteria bacterium RIFCSPHIGHO2_12_FULL_43_28]